MSSGSEPTAPVWPEQPPHLMEVYKMAVEMADRVSARRGTANSFFFALHTALSGFIALVPSPASHRLHLTAIVGAVLSVTWWILLRSYRDLNRAKFKVITDLERRLEVQVFDEEWKELRKDPVKWWRPRYAELGFIESVVPVIFLLAYIAIGTQLWLA